MLIEIKNRWTNNVMYTCEAANLKDALVKDISKNCTLHGANLGGANLRGANLGVANNQRFKTDIFDILLRAPKEIAGLRQSIIDGKVDGSVYRGECACLIGTIANIHQCEYPELGNGINPNSSCPAEQFFMTIKSGDTPETNTSSKKAVEWIDEFVGLLEMAKA